jgi:H+-translocating NAD(P) transhydrogenase subunit alpha
MSDFLVLLAVFGVSAGVAYALISRIPQMLHTPLMSMTNAISAVTILGALALFGSRPTGGEAVVGAVALLLATFNLAGGFAVTERMLRFFRRT